MTSCNAETLAACTEINGEREAADKLSAEQAKRTHKGRMKMNDTIIEKTKEGYALTNRSTVINIIKKESYMFVVEEKYGLEGYDTQSIFNDFFTAFDYALLQTLKTHAEITGECHVERPLFEHVEEISANNNQGRE